MKNNSNQIPLSGVFVRGLAMGAADVVPGVSGGTIALITGIYDRFINSLKNLGSKASFNELLKGDLKGLFIRTDSLFLAVLFSGVLTSIIVLANAITFLMVNYPHPLWSFFLGLILASAVIIFNQTKLQHKLELPAFASLFAGVVLAFGAGHVAPQDFDVQAWHFFVGGAIAICAMILPGISGSFLLLMMGLYGPILNAVRSFEVASLSLFAAGCGLGLLSFSHVISWFLTRFPAQSHLFLVGLMLGSIEKLWPWKQTISTRIKSDGTEVPLIEQAVSPFQYEIITNNSSSLWLCLFTFGIAFLCILIWGSKDGNQKEQTYDS